MINTDYDRGYRNTRKKQTEGRSGTLLFSSSTLTGSTARSYNRVSNLKVEKIRTVGKEGGDIFIILDNIIKDKASKSNTKPVVILHEEVLEPDPTEWTLYDSSGSPTNANPKPEKQLNFFFC